MAPAVVTTTAQKRDGTTTAKTLTDQTLELQSVHERRYYEQAQAKYLSENSFTVASDLRSLDRLIFFEVLMFRWQNELASGYGPHDMELSPMELDQSRKNIKETAPLISAIQNDLGLTKSLREKDQAESLSAYINRLKIAAKQHGINREKQLGKALELTKELFSLCGAYKRSNAAERTKLGYESADDIIEWVLEIMKPDFDEVDEHFRTHQQKFWVREL